VRHCLDTFLLELDEAERAEETIYDVRPLVKKYNLKDVPE